MKKEILYTGALHDKFDERYWEYDHIMKGANEFDWEEGYDIEEEIGIKIPVRDQGDTSSCVSFATAYYIWIKNVIELKNKFGLIENVISYLNNHLLSPRSIYSQVVLSGGGSYLSDNVKLIKDWGCCEENKVPFIDDETKMRDLSWKTDERDEEAKTYQCDSYRVIRAKSDIDAMAIAIRDNHGVILGVDGENNGTWKKAFPKAGKAVWGHGLYAGKAQIIDGKKYIGVLNSWGEDTGDQGWQWLGEEWFTSGMVFNPWVIVDKANTGWLWLIDKNGRERKWLWDWNKTLYYLLTKRGFKLK